MVAKQKDFSLLDELVKSVKDHKILLKTYLKDLALVMFLFFIVLSYFIILYGIVPQNPGFTKENLFSASQSSLESATADFERFYAIFIFLSILGSALILSSLSFVKLWQWGTFKKEKISGYKNHLIFFPITILIYLIAFSILAFSILSSGFFMQKLADIGASMGILQILALLVLVVFVPLTLHLINFSNYTFVKNKKFMPSLIEPFKSLGKIKHLLLPYLFIILVFVIIGLFGNLVYYYLLTSYSSKLIFSLFYLLFFILLISWEKIYSFIVFERIYK